MRTLPVAVLVVLWTLAACGDDDEPEPDAGIDAGECGAPDLDGDGEASQPCGGDDCDDGDADRRSGADDSVGDGVDQNCDDADGVDADGDGHASEASGGDDCDDADADAAPGQPDTTGDGVDADCDGADGVDADGDGHASEASGGDDCDDGDPLRNPGVPEAQTWELPGDVASSVFPWFIAIAADAGDAAHIAYRAGDGSEGRLTYATNAGGAWEIEEVDPGPDTAYGVSLAVDGGGAVHAAYFDRGGFDLRYATNASGAWVRDVVEHGNQGALVGAFPAIGVDDQGVVHVVHGARSGLKYDSGNAGEWDQRTIDGGDGVADGVAAGWISLVLDGEGRPHVGYTTFRKLRYASLAGNDWETADVSDFGIQDAYGLHLAIDGEGVAHVGAVHVGTNEQDMDLLYFDNEGGSFAEERLDWAASVALVAGPADEIHIVYARGGQLRHTTDRTGEWVGQDVAAGVDGEVVMARGPNLLHVAYGAEGGALRYTRVSPPDGIDQDCDGDAW